MSNTSESGFNWSDSFRQTYGFDLRSMAVFRICLGLMIIVDLVFRSQTLSAMYTDAGYFTRDIARKFWSSVEYSFGVESNTYWSLHQLSGAYEFQLAMFILAGVAALFLVVGAWTRVATIVSWVLLVSLQTRNPLILTSGDTLLKMMLFWSMFIPLGKAWSVDACRKNSDLITSRTFVSFATFGMVVQLFCMYFFAGIAKWNDVWHDGVAMEYVLRLNIYTNSFGESLLAYPTMLKLVTWVTLWGEIILPWLMFFPAIAFGAGYKLIYHLTGTGLRIFLIAVFWALHISIALSMDIGLFCYISMLAWLPMIPGAAWNWCGVKLKLATGRLQPYSQLRKTGQIVVGIVCLFFVYLVVSWNVAQCESPAAKKYTEYAMPKALRWFALTAKVRQVFRMFDRPPSANPWFVYHAVLRNGEEVDIMRGGEPVDYSRPNLVKETMENLRWRKLHRNLVEIRSELLRQQLADYAVAEWNRTHEEQEQVVRLQLTCVLDHIGPDYSPVNRTTDTWGIYQTEEAAGSTFDKFAKEFEEQFGKIDF